MKTLRLLLLFMVVNGAAEFALDAPSARAAPTPVPSDSPLCKAGAYAVRRAARFEAYSDYWLQVANILNGPWKEIPAGFAEATRKLRVDLELADDQFVARLKANLTLGEDPYDPLVIPSEFSPIVNNVYMPLIPNRVLIYEMRTASGLERKEVTTYSRTAKINGVTCRVVRELEIFNGKVIEDTINWYAQHRNGDVWYFGEVAQHYDDGILDSLDGSWRYGKDDAKPGIVMQSSPVVGESYRQEYSLNVTEDLARVISVNATANVPAGKFHNCVQTMDWSPLEPFDETDKFYSPAVGLVMEVDLTTGDRLELIEIKQL